MPHGEVPGQDADVDDALAARARAWIAEDPEPADRAELAALLAVGDEAAVRDRFAAPLEFGTAGLRGVMRAGPNGMNRGVVRRAAAGLAGYLGSGRTVVIGYDARRRSDVFAADSAAVLAGAGLRALVLPRPLPTPVLAFAVRHLGADAGVMVTASHNPAADNGCKVYLGDGAQIVPPADREIEAAIEAVGPLTGVPRSDRWERLGDEVARAYRDAVVALSLLPERDVRVAYTPLHGVGRDLLLDVFAHAGFPPPAVVAEQAEPDPGFPTVAFPNPEEPGAMDHLLALAASTGADLAIANDPDADRCAVAVGGRALRGDELGVLLADHVLRHRRGRVATTVVSSSWLRSVAAGYGVAYSETLTGFKWIMRAGDDLVYGYEEAIGYAVGPRVVRDKDGISAALLAAELAAAEKRVGRTLLDRLDDLARAHGLHATDQLSLRADDPRRVGAAMRRLRAAPPGELAGRPVESAVDLAGPGTGLPPTDVLVYRLAGRARVVVRPSGTEPKLKAYLEVVVPVTGSVAAARTRADGELAALRATVGNILRL